MKQDILIAFDQSTRKTGYSVWNINKKELITYGLIEVNNRNTMNRISKIKKMINSIYKEIESIANITIIFEDIQYQEKIKEGISFESSSKNNNVLTFKILAWLQGVLMNWSYENNIPYSSMFSSTWKSFCKIKGETSSTQKQNAINFVKENFNIEVSSDVADAICIGWTAINK